MSKRIISGLTGTFLVFAVLIFNQNFLMLINILIAIISVLSMLEIFSAMGTQKLRWITIPTLLFVPIMPLIGYGLVWQIFWYIYTITMFIVMILNNTLKLRDISLVYMMALIITISLSKVVQLRDFGGEYGSFYVLLGLGLAWTSDTGAYFFGKYFGKNKLCPTISPKKTIEGVIGGIVVCVISMIVIGLIFNNFIFPEKYQINYWALALLGISGSPISALGDLCFSVIKRNCHIKDFGNVIPGHGGVLDRFDSVIFVVPYVYLFIKLVPIIL